MSQQYDNTNRGALFVNDRKQSDKHPDMNGKINIDGVEYWLSGYRKNTARGEVLSLALGKPVEQKQAQPVQQASRGRGRPQPRQCDDFQDDDIPF